MDIDTHMGKYLSRDQYLLISLVPLLTRPSGLR
jgi:hypothetical protein